MLTITLIILGVSEFVGRFHPLLVHLPIGILVLAVLFHFISRKEKYAPLAPAVLPALFWGMISAWLSCISGYLLSQTGEYEENLVSKHQWLGILTAVIASLAWYTGRRQMNLFRWTPYVMILLLLITGHLGGTLTHGEGYLTSALKTGPDYSANSIKPIADVQNAVAYTDIIQPILKQKCYTCHGPGKQKGKLRLDEQSFIEKGGKSGKAVVAGNISESELINRILLPAENEDHMPPREKPQLSTAQTALLNWWVASGADFHKKVSELKQPDNIKPHLAALQTGKEKAEVSQTNLPEKPVEKAPDSLLKSLAETDVSVSTVGQNSNYLSVNFAAIDSITETQVQLLKKLSRQITWLKLGDVKINTLLLEAIGEMPNLTQLHLNKTSIADKDLAFLKNLQQLEYLNLSETNVSGRGLAALTSLKKISKLYLYKTNSNADDFAALKKTFPNAKIDTGGYKLEFLAADTMLAKPKTVK